MLKTIIGSCLLGILLTACHQDGKTSTYTLQEIRDAWEKDGRDSSVVKAAEHECKDDVAKGLGNLTAACLNFGEVSKQMGKKVLDDGSKN